MHNSSCPLEEILRDFSSTPRTRTSSRVKGSLLFDEGYKIVLESFPMVFGVFSLDRNGDHGFCIISDGESVSFWRDVMEGETCS